MEYNHEYICKMKQTVLCELCNKSYRLPVAPPPSSSIWSVDCVSLPHRRADKDHRRRDPCRIPPAQPRQNLSHAQTIFLCHTHTATGSQRERLGRARRQTFSEGNRSRRLRPPAAYSSSPSTPTPAVPRPQDRRLCLRPPPPSVPSSPPARSSGTQGATGIIRPFT